LEFLNEFDQVRIAALLHVLFRHGRNIMAGSAQNLPAALTEILVELEFHAAGSRGTVT